MPVRSQLLRIVFCYYNSRQFPKLGNIGPGRNGEQVCETHCACLDTSLQIWHVVILQGMSYNWYRFGDTAGHTNGFSKHVLHLWLILSGSSKLQSESGLLDIWIFLISNAIQLLEQEKLIDIKIHKHGVNMLAALAGIHAVNLLLRNIAGNFLFLCL